MSGDRQVDSRVICYSDGWCEQGGYVSGSAGNKTVTLLKKMKNTSYNIAGQNKYSTGTTLYATDVVDGSVTKTGFTYYVPYAYGAYWRVAGIADGY